MSKKITKFVVKKVQGNKTDFLCQLALIYMKAQRREASGEYLGWEEDSRINITSVSTGTKIASNPKTNITTGNIPARGETP